MSKLPVSFNAKKQEGRMGDFSALAVGEYPSRLKENSRVPTKKNKEENEGNKIAIKNGTHLYKLTWEVTQGKYKGRLVFSNLNLEHEDEATQERAYNELGSICDAFGKAALEDLDDLKGEIILKLGISKATAEYPEGNKITAYLPLKGIKKPSAVDDDEEEEVSKPKPAFDKPKPKVSFGKK